MMTRQTPICCFKTLFVSFFIPQRGVAVEGIRGSPLKKKVVLRTSACASACASYISGVPFRRAATAGPAHNAKIHIYIYTYIYIINIYI